MGIKIGKVVESHDKIVKIIKERFIKKIKQQKNNKLDLFNAENEKLKKGDKKVNTIMTKAEYNNAINEKKKIITEYFDDKIKNIEIANMLGIKAIKFETIEDILNNV